MAQITAQQAKSALRLEDVVPVKVGNEEFMGDGSKGAAKKLIEKAADDLKDTYMGRNRNCDKKQLSLRLKAFRSILSEIYNSEGYGKLAEFCKAVAENSLHNFADDHHYLAVSERFCESLGAKSGASLIRFMQDKIGASIGDVNLVFSQELLKDGKKKEEVLRALDAIGGWFKGTDDAVNLRSVAFSNLRFALGTQPNEDLSEKNIRALLGSLSDSHVESSLEKLILRHEFTVMDYFKIIAYAGLGPAEKYAAIIAKNGNKESFGNVRYMEERTFRSELKGMSSEAVRDAQDGQMAEFEKVLSQMEKLVKSNNAKGN